MSLIAGLMLIRKYARPDTGTDQSHPGYGIAPQVVLIAVSDVVMFGGAAAGLPWGLLPHACVNFLMVGLALRWYARHSTRVSTTLRSWHRASGVPIVLRTSPLCCARIAHT